MLGLMLYGSRFDGSWPQSSEDADYADLKGIVENLREFLHLPALEYAAYEGEHPFLLPCVAIRADGRTLGVMGRVRPEQADAFYARKDVWLAELNLEEIRRLHDAAAIKFAPLPVFPPVRRDITIMANRSVRIGAVLAHIAGLRLPLLENVVLHDCFEPEDSEERNLTFRLTFRHADRTLKDAEVDKEREKVAQSLVRDLGVRV